MNMHQEGHFFVVAKSILVKRKQTTPKPLLITEEDLKGYEKKLEEERHQEDKALSPSFLNHKTLKKPFKCLICDRSYARRETLDNHDKKVHEMKRFKCDFCDKIYRERGNLSIHKRDVHNIFSIKCSKCGTKLRTKKLLKIHMAVEHDVVHSSLV